MLFVYSWALKVLADIYEKEYPTGVIVAFGGQLPNNIAGYLARSSPFSDFKINIFGTLPDFIEIAENRFKFSRLLDKLQVCSHPLNAFLPSILNSSKMEVFFDFSTPVEGNK